MQMKLPLKNLEYLWEEEKLIKFVKRDQPSRSIFFLTPVLAIFLTLVSGGLIFYFLGFKPLEALKFFFVVPISDVYGFSELLLKATPLCLIAIGLSFCFKSNNWNIGAEGQLTFGGIVSGGVALIFYEQEGFHILCLFFKIPQCIWIKLKKHTRGSRL